MVFVYAPENTLPRSDKLCRKSGSDERKGGGGRKGKAVASIRI